MSLLAWFTIAAFAVLLTAVAVTLLVIVALLWRTRSTLDDVVDALGRVADGAEPLGGWLVETNGHLAAARDALVTAAPAVDDDRTGRRAGAVR
jgi:hypothetical protein